MVWAKGAHPARVEQQHTGRPAGSIAAAAARRCSMHLKRRKNKCFTQGPPCIKSMEEHFLQHCTQFNLPLSLTHVILSNEKLNPDIHIIQTGRLSGIIHRCSCISILPGPRLAIDLIRAFTIPFISVPHAGCRPVNRIYCNLEQFREHKARTLVSNGAPDIVEWRLDCLHAHSTPPSKYMI